MAKKKGKPSPRSSLRGYSPGPVVSRSWNDLSWTPPPGPPAEPGPVKLMPEYTVELPLWLQDWWDLDLPRDLLNDLADWQVDFDAHFDPSKGWSSDATRDAWAAQAGRLTDRLRATLPEGFSLEVDLWPLEVG